MGNELREDLISAALDGEQVDVEALRGVLRNEDGRETLAAFVLLRAATAADQILPTRSVAEFAQRAAGARRLCSFAPSRLRIACAASVVFLALVGAFWVGTTLRGPEISLQVVAAPTAPAMATAPPVTNVPASPASGDHRASMSVRASDLPLVWAVPEPPTPTRRLSFVPGVDWTSTP